MSEELLERLLNVHPRHLAVLQHVAFDGGTVQSLAERYGVTEAAAGSLLAGAVQAIDTPDQASPEPRAAVEFLKRSNRLEQLKTNALVLKDGLAQAERRRAAAPLRRWETPLRWVAIIVILALSAYFWLAERERERRPQPRPVKTTWRQAAPGRMMAA